MIQQLTYADRELLFHTFDILKAEWKGDDDALLSAALEWVNALVPHCGFENALARDITALSRYLTTRKAEDDVADIARGGLLYVTQAEQRGPSRLRDLDLLDDAFMAGYAVHEIQTRIDEPAFYSTPRLSKEERQKAENLFLEMTDTPILNDEELILQSRTIGSKLGPLATCGFFQRLQKNIEFLIAVITDQDRAADQQTFARAALRYLVCEQNVIDDRLGIVGYVDDNFIVQTAVDLIEKARDPLLELLDVAIGAWPFLNAIVIDDGGGSRPLSEYMIINSALSCHKLRGEDANTTVLVVPSSEHVPFLLGFISTLAMIQESGQRNVTEQSFSLGQKVLVDNHAVAVFNGIKEINGQQRFCLTQFRRQCGQLLDSTYYWPLADLRRLVPADSQRTTRGRLTHDLEHTDLALPALEYIFNSSKMTNVASVSSLTIVVTPVTQAHDWAKTLRMYEYDLKDVVPMGHISGDQAKPWSSRFGEQQPLLLFVSDLDAACVYAEKHRDVINMIVIDMSGRNINKTASLAEIKRMGLRTLVVSPEITADDLPNSDDDSTQVWEWSVEDYSGLLWPRSNQSTSGILSRHEQRIIRQVASAPEVRTLQHTLATTSFESVSRLRSLARLRGEDTLAELDEAVVLAFQLLSRLLRSPTPLEHGVPSFHDVNQDIERLRETAVLSRFMSQEERTAVTSTTEILQEFFNRLCRENPKALSLLELLHAHPGMAVISPDARIIRDLEQVMKNGSHSIFSDYANSDGALIQGAVVPGWFRKERMKRLLIPPATEPLILVLYDIEHEWYEDFSFERRKSNTLRKKHAKRDVIFPGVAGWVSREIDLPQRPLHDQATALGELEGIHDHVRVTLRRNAYRTAQSDGTEIEVTARLILFEGGVHAFLKDSYKATVVTHLLDSVVDIACDESIDVSRRTVKELNPNDALLFNRRSDRDVIRLAADEELADGVRDTATLWHRVLIRFFHESGLSPKDVWKRLKDGGCPLQFQTVRGWLDDDEMIAPRQYERDVAIIAKVTGDQKLNSHLEQVLDCIRSVFGAHQRVSHKLAKQVLRKAVDILKEEQLESRLVELESDVVLARVMEIDDHDSKVRVSMVNRLLETEQWHA